MNNGASTFLKHIISVLSSIRNKTNAVKARLVVLSVLKDKKFSLGSISHKIQAVLGQQDKKRGGGGGGGGGGRGHEEDVDQSKAIVLYNALVGPSSSIDRVEEDADHQDQYYYYDYNDDKYPDLTHSLFEEEDEDEDEDDELDLGDPNGSVIDLVRSSKEVAGGDHEDFKLEDEINQVADLFIMKFHKRIRMQKLESFKRYQEMLQRST